MEKAHLKGKIMIILMITSTIVLLASAISEGHVKIKPLYCKMQNNSCLVLNSSKNYILQSQPWCINKFSSNVTIRSSSFQPATIKCQPNPSSNSTTGFGFIHARNLIIENIVFENCGATLSSDALQSVNSSDLYYPPHYAAVLLFNHCWNITLTNVTVKNYYGFAIVAANVLGTSVFQSLNVTNSAMIPPLTLKEKDIPSVGSGMLIHYLDSENQSKEGYHEVIVSGSTFSNNINYMYMKTCQSYTYKDCTQPRPIANAAALTSFTHKTLLKLM